MSGFSIVESQLQLVGGLGGHDLLILKDPEGRILGELDGLATGADGNIKPIGYLSSDTLKFYSFDGRYLYSDSQPQQTIYSGDLEDVLSRWNAAIDAGEEINKLNLPYPFMGLGDNSNAVASTLIAAMGINETAVPGSAAIMPGRGSILLPKELLDQIRDNNNISGAKDSGGDGTQVETDDLPNGDVQYSYDDGHGNTATVTLHSDGSSDGRSQTQDGVSTIYHDDGKGTSTATSYNSDGNVISTATAVNSVDGQGNATTTTTTVNHDPNTGARTGSSVTTDDGHANTTTSNFNGDGSLASVSWNHADGSYGSSTYNSDGSSSTTAVNADGSSVVSESDGHGNATTNNYDSNGRLTGDSWTHDDGTHGTDTHNADGSSSGTAVNADGSSSAYQDDGHGDRTTTNYDPNGGVTSVKDVATQTDDQGNVTTTTTTTNYDPNAGGETGHSVSVNDGHGDTSTSTYDGNGNLTSYGWQTEDGGSGTNTYGPNGQITNETWNDGNGNSGSNTYDSNGTLESSSWQSNDGHSGTNNYDQNGNLISDSWQSPDGTTGTDTYNSDGSRASDTWQSTGGSYGSDTYNQDGSVASSSVTTVTTNADGSVTTSTREDNYSTGSGDSYGGGYGGGYGGDYGGGYGGGYGDIYNDTTITTNPDGSSVEVVSTNQYGYGDTTTTVTSADGSYNTTETTAMGITWETSYDATTGEHDNSTIYNDGSRVDNQQQADGTNTSTERDANGNVTRVEVSNGDSDVTTIYQGNGTVSVDTRTGDDHVIETTNPDGSHSETRITNDWNDRITDNYDASGRLTSEDGYNASIPSDNTSSGTISSSWETTYNSDGSSSTHEIEMAGNGQITHDTETDSYGHTVSTSTTIEVNGVSDQTTQNADGSHSTAHWDDNGNYDSHQYDADGHDIHDVSRGSDGSYSDQTYDPTTGSTTEDAYNGSTGEHSTYESSYDADGIHHEITTLDRADGSSETQQTDTINGISLMTDTSSDGTTNYYMNGSGISADQFDQYWQDYFAGDGASNDPGAGDPGTDDPGAGDGSSSTPDMPAGTNDQQAAA